MREPSAPKDGVAVHHERLLRQMRSRGPLDESATFRVRALAQDMTMEEKIAEQLLATGPLIKTGKNGERVTINPLLRQQETIQRRIKDALNSLGL